MGADRFDGGLDVQCMCPRSSSQFPVLGAQIRLLRVDPQMAVLCHQEVGMLKQEAMKRNQDRFGSRAANLRLVFVAKHSD